MDTQLLYWLVLTLLYILIPSHNAIDTIIKIAILSCMSLFQYTKKPKEKTEGLFTLIYRYKASIFLSFGVPILTLIYYLWPLTNRPSITAVLVEGVLYAIMVGFFEEFLFREYLFDCLKQYFTRMNALLINAFLFGIAHVYGMIGQPIPVIGMRVLWNMALGLYLAALKEKTNSLLLVGLIHTLVDMSVVIFLYSSQDFYPMRAALILLMTYYALGAYGLYLCQDENE